MNQYRYLSSEEYYTLNNFYSTPVNNYSQQVVNKFNILVVYCKQEFSILDAPQRISAKDAYILTKASLKRIFS